MIEYIIYAPYPVLTANPEADCIILSIAGIWETVLRYMKTKTVTLDEFIGMSFEHQMAYLRTVKGYFETQRLEVPDSWKSVWNNEKVLEIGSSDGCIIS